MRRTMEARAAVGETAPGDTALKGSLLALVLPALSLCSFQDRPGPPFVTRSEVLARHGMVATSQPLATQAALEILRKGGSAVDAAIAANALLGVVEPTGCGIGGDLFTLVWSAKDKKLYGLNASGRSPRAIPISRASNSIGPGAVRSAPPPRATSSSGRSTAASSPPRPTQEQASRSAPLRAPCSPNSPSVNRANERETS